MLGKAAGASVGVSRQFQKVIWNHQGNLLATIEKDGNGSTKQICLFELLGYCSWLHPHIAVLN